MNSILEIVLAVLALIYYLIESLIVAFIPSKWKAKDVGDDIVLVTGAGSGIGRLLAVRFAKLGCKVVVWDINKEGNRETVAIIHQVGGKAYPYECDVSNREEIFKTAQQVKEEVGNVTILINNAGIVTGKSLLDCPNHMIEKTFAVNVLAHFWTVKAFLPDMIRVNKGHIVTIASLAGMCGINKLSDYCSSKFAAVGFDESLRVELKVDGRKNIKTTVVCPYYVNTGMFDGVTSKILPILTPESVADATVNGILNNDTMVIVPKYCYLLIVLKMMMPFKAGGLFMRTFGFTSLMEEFRGRGGGKKD